MAQSLDYSTLDEVKPQRKLYDHVAPFFVEVSKALNYLRGKFLIEAVLGDCIDVAEGIRYGLISDETENINGIEENSIGHTETKVIRPKNFPKQFDRIHLSNIPQVSPLQNPNILLEISSNQLISK